MKLTCTIVFFITLLFFFTHPGAHAQKSKVDSLFNNADTTAVLDSLMKDFDSFLDSVYRHKSFFNVSLGMGTGIFSFEDKNSVFITTEKKLIMSPVIGYFHKSGLGLSTAAYTIYDKNKINLYQVAVTPSYDLIRRKFSTGISFSRYFNKDSLDFYTTPIQNEVFAYFTYKNWWVRPSISFSYGWGTKTQYEKEQYFIWSRLLQRNQSYYVTVKNQESIRDFSMTLAVRKDFDWYDVLAKDDDITLTPAILLNSGTQNFGFNTSYTSNQTTAIRINSVPSNSEISETSDFALQSVSGVLRASYFKGKFMCQPQVFFDYALWNTDKRFNTVYSFMVSLSF